MAEELGTRDVLEQVDARLDNVEQDIRGLRADMNDRFTQVGQKIEKEVGGLQVELRSVRSESAVHNRWLLGVMLASWLSIIASLWLKS